VSPGSGRDAQRNGTDFPTEGIPNLKNIHTRLLLVILALLAGSAWVVYKYPTHKGLDIQGGMRVVLRAETEKLPKGTTWDYNKLQTVSDIMRNRVDALGVAEPVVYPKPPEQIIVELPGIKDKDKALKVIESTAKLEFRYIPELDNGEWSTRPEEINGRETGYEQIIGRNALPVSQEELQVKVFDKEPILTGAELKPNARADYGQAEIVVHFEFKDQFKGKFEDFTRSHIGKRLAVFLDQRLISAPTIEDVIPGIGIIRGRFSAEQAKTLANQLNAGALPVPLEQQGLVSVEATLGNQAVRQTTIAGIIGLALVLLFMLYYYRLPGFLADIALVLYTLFTFAIFKLVPVTLTVPGIAGFILSIGMAVDANILIFERMKEERLSGKSLRAAIETGFKRAFSAIFDSNMCTIITCVILYNFGTGQVRGFALTLGLGVVVSMFTAIIVSRTFLLLLADTAFGQNDQLYQLGKGLHPRLNVTKRMFFWFGLSGAVIVPGLIFWLGLGGIKPSIEFTGGTETIVQFNRHVSSSQIAAAFTRAGHREARILMASGENQAYVTTKRIDSTAEKARVQQALAALGGSVQSQSTVSGAISAELTHNAILAVIYASVLIILYLAIRFSIPNFVEGLKYGTCAVIALFHDVGVIWGVMAFFGFMSNWQIDSLFVTAALTVIGFSVHDTIIIFDRIRENLRHRARGETYAEVADRSIEQTFSRSVYTSFTVILTLTALLVFGGATIRTFVTILLVGIISGTYSSIFNATPLLVLWKRLTGDREMVAATAGGPAARPAPARRPEPASRPRPAASNGPATTPPPQVPTGQTSVESPTLAAGGAQRVKPKTGGKKKRRM
jgi:SecD/SecF fusion protein